MVMKASFQIFELLRK